MTTLDKAQKGQVIKISSIDNPDIKTQAIRLGIGEGEVVTCREIIPAGPVVICKCKQEVAIGRQLARKIGIEPVALPLNKCASRMVADAKTPQRAQAVSHKI
ncbi:MAG: ferrous iron transport protein A [Firmicutes bacterium]|nr:ferrous iron transport protein A [Bacillota bacterium]